MDNINFWEVVPPVVAMLFGAFGGWALLPRAVTWVKKHSGATDGWTALIVVLLSVAFSAVYMFGTGLIAPDVLATSESFVSFASTLILFSQMAYQHAKGEGPPPPPTE